MEKSMPQEVIVTAQSSSGILEENNKEKEVEQICQWIQDLGDHEKRENALLQIRYFVLFCFFIKKHEILFQQAKRIRRRSSGLVMVFLRHSQVHPSLILSSTNFYFVSVLLQEIISIYPYILPPTLTAVQSNRVCNALALMQCIASHKDTRKQFLEGLSG
jgi:hypothetical protein